MNISKLQNRILQVLFGITLFFVALGQLQRLTFPGGALYVHDIFIGLFIMTSLLFSRVKLPRIKEQTLSTQTILTLIAIGCCILSTTIAAIANQTFIPVLYIGRLIMYVFFSYAVLQMFPRDAIKKSWITTIIAMAYLGILQYIFVPDTRFLFALGWDDHYYRLIGTLFDPAFTGLAFVLGAIATFNSKAPAKIKYLLLIILAICVTLTYSRSSWLAAFVASAYLITTGPLKIKLDTIRILCVLFVIGFGTFLIAPRPGGEGVNISRTSTIEARGNNFIQSFSQSQNSYTFLFGEGLFTTSVNSKNEIPNHARVPDNLLALLFKGGGVVGLISGISAFGLLVFKNLKRKPESNTLLIALFTHSMFNASFIQPFIFLMFWGLYSSIEE